MDVTLHPGETLADKYRIERELGTGGMASVFEVMHLELGERAAIKLLRSDVVHMRGVVERFSREARAMSRLRSEHVARVRDVGRLPTGQPYMVMEYLEGTDLSEAIEARGVFEAREAVDLMLQACEALAEAHARGIVHRDLKPSNLFLTNRSDGTPVVKVLDFGISKIAAGANADAMSLTHTRALLGSPLYMAPEQIASARDADERADVWGIGTVLYEMLVGGPPFHAETLRHLQYLILNEKPASIRTTRPGFSEALEAVVLKCLEKDPEARFADMGALARGLEPFATERGRPYADRVCSIVSRAHALAAPSGPRTVRMDSADFSADAAEVVVPVQTATKSMSDQLGHLPTFDASDQGDVMKPGDRVPPLEGTHGAWGGTQKRGSTRSRVGLIAAGLVGVAALVTLAFASARYLSADGQTALPAPPASASVTIAAAGLTLAPMPATPASATPEPSTSVAIVPAPPDVVPPRKVAGRTAPARAPGSVPPSSTMGAKTGKEGGLFDTRK